MLNIQRLWEVLNFCSNWKVQLEVNVESTPTNKSCRQCFKFLKGGNFQIEDRGRPC